MSHWSVASVATVKFGAFDELKNDPTIGRAVALRRAEMAMLDPKNPPEFAHPLSGRRSCSLAKVARKGKIDRSEMAIRGISAGGLRRSSLVRQTAGYGAFRSFRASRRSSPDERTAVAEHPTWELVAKRRLRGLPAGAAPVADFAVVRAQAAV
ncbi:MAG: hypothetical protein JOY65_14390 [Acetobacteraceae bacterium]|nr:hypothetical protein [Acetobacteraceae bacterium]